MAAKCELLKRRIEEIGQYYDVTSSGNRLNISKCTISCKYTCIIAESVSLFYASSWHCKNYFNSRFLCEIGNISDTSLTGTLGSEEDSLADICPLTRSVYHM